MVWEAYDTFYDLLEPIVSFEEDIYNLCLTKSLFTLQKKLILIKRIRFIFKV